MINTKLFSSSALYAAILLGTLTTTTASYAVDYYGNGYQVGVVRPGGDRACMLFQLVGVTQADASLVPGSPWFSIPDTAPDYKEMVATLLLAKATDRPIYVTTSGAIPSACGHPGVSTILLP